MADQTLTKLTAAAPLAIAGLLVLLNPIYDKLIEQRAKPEFSNSTYLPAGGAHTPMTIIKSYTSWALDVAQAGPLVLGPVVGLSAALGFGKTNIVVTWIYFAFILVGFVIFCYVITVEHPALYGKKKIGWSWHKKLLFGWTLVSILVMILYFGASAAAAVFA